MQDTSQNITDSFIKGLNKDSDPSYVTEGMWTHAINMVNNSKTGRVGSLSNESANYICFESGKFFPPQVKEKYVIGAIYLYSDKWVILTAGHNSLCQPINSEIGLFEEENCVYRPIVIDPCLKFDKRYLISGTSREREDCTWQIYWADGLNPDRFLNIGNSKTWPSLDNHIFGGATGVMANYYSLLGTSTKSLWPGVQWNETCKIINDCNICENVNTLDCERIRLARLMTTPCLRLKLGQTGGTLANGSYFVVIAYLINGQKVTDYFSQSNYQFVYSPDDLEGSLDLEIEADRLNFDEFELVIVSCTNQQTVAKRMGVYSTNTSALSFDQIDPSNITIPLEQLPLRTPVFESSDQIAELNTYLLRVGPKSKFDFNYQPLANMITTKWASVEYPANYYMKGGNKTNYMRDEVYSFFIRWVYNTGDKTSSYHIPGRAPRDFTLPTTGVIFKETSTLNGDTNTLTTDERVFEIYNTATADNNNSYIGTTTDDGGTVIATGDMGYWQSTESYPDNRPEIWNPSSLCWTGATDNSFDLCGKNIRHHKFPEDFINGSNTADVIRFRSNPTPQTNVGNDYFIRLMGVFFTNIQLPKDNDGNDIPGIAGYEILRGSREGNKTIVAKGMVNNYRTYKISGNNNYTGLYANYPFNTITPISSALGGNVAGQSDPFIKAGLVATVPSDIISFHSPDTMFRTPFLSTPEFKIYGHLQGLSNQQFVTPSDHPKFKLLSDATVFVMIIFGLAEAIIAGVGKRTTVQAGPAFQSLVGPDITGKEIGGGDISGGSSGQESINGAGSAAIYNVNVNHQPIVGKPLTGGDISTKEDEYTDLSKNAVISNVAALQTAVTTYNATTGALADLATAGLVDVLGTAYQTSATTNLTQKGAVYTAPELHTEIAKTNYLPGPLRILAAGQNIATYFSQGVDIALKILYAVTSYKPFALQMKAYGFYSQMQPVGNTDTKRFTIDDAFYLRDNIQQMSKYLDNTNTYRSYSINNLKRPATVTLRVKNGANQNVGPKLLNIDESLVTLGTLKQIRNPSVPNFGMNDTDDPFSLPIASHYGALKGRVRNQYGQLDSIKQITISNCEQKLSVSNVQEITAVTCNSVSKKRFVIPRTPIFFGGDTYVNRYTEKNNMLFFFDWLYSQPDGFEYNYYLKSMIPHPRFRLNSQLYDSSNLASLFTDFANFADNAQTPGTGPLPSNFYNLDYFEGTTKKYDYVTDTASNYPGFFICKDSYFYLAASSIRDFFVESEVLLDFRKQADNIGNKFYDPYRYTNYQEMFDMNPEIMGKNSFYQYDYSLSVSKLYNQYFSLGSMQSRYYNPNVSELCYTYYPNRIIYSLPQQDEAIKDSWFVYLINNYRTFKSQISGVKPINKSGIMITFKNDSPVMFQGVDTLNTDLGTKVTIGDGGLFSQPGQAVANSDKAYEYGASQNRLSVISTPVGIFYISQAAGKIFSYGQGLQELSQQGMKWWFTLFLPYKLTVDFPLYPYQDNPVAGIGCQSVFDNTNTILYFCKKDYQLIDSFKRRTTYVPLKSDGTGDYFIVDNNQAVQYRLGDTTIFRDASWTISYDPKSQFWISFHDWHPDLLLPTKDVFISTKGAGGWRHNWLCDSYCKYYGVDYACEIDIPIVSGQTITTTRSIEYIMEAYRKSDNCVDSHHVLDFNFDTAVVYNSEQVSGYLNLNLYPKNDLILARQYPKLNLNNNSFDILFSKEENKYRFNQFWDITNNRGEFPLGGSYPPIGQVIPDTTVLIGNYAGETTWITEPDGFRRTLNFNNLDYSKPELQRKKFRHYMSFVNLKKNKSGNTNIILKISNSKNETSLR
jgi:hypothetical protein